MGLLHYSTDGHYFSVCDGQAFWQIRLPDCRMDSFYRHDDHICELLFDRNFFYSLRFYKGLQTRHQQGDTKTSAREAHYLNLMLYDISDLSNRQHDLRCHTRMGCVIRRCSNRVCFQDLVHFSRDLHADPAGKWAIFLRCDPLKHQGHVCVRLLL